VHPFWSSHEEKRACVRLSMGGVMAGVRVPWPAMGSSPERKGKVERGRG
jgi:hypothetical protein